MPQGRHDYPNSIHLVRVQGRAGHEIFFPEWRLREQDHQSRQCVPSIQFWESLIARTCDRWSARVHGYAWLPNQAAFLVQRFAVPLRIILASLLGQYSRYLHNVGNVPYYESPYLDRCASIEVTPELLPYALRNLYAGPIRAGLCATPQEYRFCSLDLHCSANTPPWLETREFLQRIRKRGHFDRASIAEFLARPEAPRHAKLFDLVSARTPQIAGEQSDIEESIQFARHAKAAPSVEQIAETVRAILGKASRPYDGVLAAALTTWHATRTGAATLAQMGRWFQRQPTTLRADIESHRKSSPELFDVTIQEFKSLMQNGAPDVRQIGSKVLDQEPTRLCRTLPSSRAPNEGIAALPRGRNSRSFRRADSAAACAITANRTSHLHDMTEADVPLREHRNGKLP